MTDEQRELADVTDQERAERVLCEANPPEWNHGDAKAIEHYLAKLKDADRAWGIEEGRRLERTRTIRYLKAQKFSIEEGRRLERTRIRKAVRDAGAGDECDAQEILFAMYEALGDHTWAKCADDPAKIDVDAPQPDVTAKDYRK